MGNTSLGSILGRRRKISEVESAEEKAEIKRRKLEDKENEITNADDVCCEASDCSETSERFEDLSFHNIQDYLRPQEIALLKRDPFGANFRTSVWTNEFTMRRKNHQTSPWLNRDARYTSDVLPSDVFVEILSRCDVLTLLKMRHVSMWMNRVITEDQSIWRKLFYRRHWRLKHDIENNFVGTDPDSVDKSDWINVVPDNEVDWIEEYKRNYINSTHIRRLFEEIKSKLERLVDEVGVVRERVTNPMIFEPGVSDEEIDERIVMDGLPITNDLHELLKCCNGERFWTDFSTSDRVFENTSFPFPKLSNLSLGLTQQRHMELDNYFENLRQYSYCKERLVEEEGILRPYSFVKLSESDLSSDGEDYVASGQEDSSSSSSESLEDPFFWEGPADNRIIYFNADITPKSQQLYNPITGSLEIVPDRSFDDDEDEDGLDPSTNYDFSRKVVYDSIVTYLQEISDHLDFGHTFRWLQFDDYTIPQIDQNYAIHDDSTHCQNVTDFWWTRLAIDIGWEVAVSTVKFTPRAEKLLYAAYQDFLVKVFAKAQQLEKTDTLQPDTLIAAAKQMEPNNYEYCRVTDGHERFEKLQQQTIDL